MCVHACVSVCPDMNFILCVSCMCVHVYPVCAYTWMCISGYLCVCAGVYVSCMCVYAWMSIWSACVSWKCVHMCVLHVRMLECASCESVIMKEEASVPTKLVSSSEVCSTPSRHFLWWQRVHSAQALPWAASTVGFHPPANITVTRKATFQFG